MQAGGLLFFHWWQWHFEFHLGEIHTHDFRSHFQQDFLAYCTRPVSVHLAMVCVSCSFDSFSISFLLSLKQQNLMKIMFSCIHFPIWPYPSQIMKKLFCTSKLYGLTGIWTVVNRSVIQMPVLLLNTKWHEYESDAPTKYSEIKEIYSKLIHYQNSTKIRSAKIWLVVQIRSGSTIST